MFTEEEKQELRHVLSEAMIRYDCAAKTAREQGDFYAFGWFFQRRANLITIVDKLGG